MAFNKAEQWRGVVAGWRQHKGQADGGRSARRERDIEREVEQDRNLMAAARDLERQQIDLIIAGRLF